MLRERVDGEWTLCFLRVTSRNTVSIWRAMEYIYGSVRSFLSGMAYGLTNPFKSAQ
jgi:hypothetical protein